MGWLLSSLARALMRGHYCDFFAADKRGVLAGPARRADRRLD
jgi:hypothetical protein